MKAPLVLVFLLAGLLLFPPCLVANSNKVGDWVEKTLLLSTSLNFAVKKNEANPIRARYTLNGWYALSHFLSPHGERHLGKFFHPAPLSKPVVVNSGIVTNSSFFSGVPYWRVNQVIVIPEMNIRVAFSVLVIETTDKHYLIQSLDMVKDAL